MKFKLYIEDPFSFQDSYDQSVLQFLPNEFAQPEHRRFRQKHLPYFQDKNTVDFKLLVQNKL